MRIRLPFAGAFLCLVGLSAYLGLFPSRQIPINDKVLHFVDFFILTICFYFLIDASRRRVINFTLIVVTLALGAGSEIVQALVPNGRTFDIYDIAANVLGSLLALWLCSWYHKRMLERKRLARRYHPVATTADDGDDPVDLEMMPDRTSPVVDSPGAQQEESASSVTASLEARVEQWDENAEDEWGDDNDVDDDKTLPGSDLKDDEGGSAVAPKELDE